MSDETRSAQDTMVCARVLNRWVVRLMQLTGGGLLGLALVAVTTGSERGFRLGVWITPLLLALLMGIAKSGTA